MKTISSRIAGSFSDDVANLCYVCSLQAFDGTVYRMTDADADIAIGGDVYSANRGFDVSSVQVQSQTQGSSCEVRLLLGEAFTKLDLIRGRLDKAIFTVWLTDYKKIGAIGAGDPADLALIYSGTVGQIVFEDELVATLQVGSLLDQYRDICTEKVSYSCRADFGDIRCKVSLDDKKRQLTVVAGGTSAQSLTSTGLTDDDDYWAAGLLKFTSGLNLGYVVEVASYKKVNGAIGLRLPAPRSIQEGDTADIFPGCDKAYTTCRDRWSNTDNFRGEPLSLAPVTKRPTVPVTLPVPAGATVTIRKPRRARNNQYGGGGFSVTQY